MVGQENYVGLRPHPSPTYLYCLFALLSTPPNQKYIEASGTYSFVSHFTNISLASFQCQMQGGCFAWPEDNQGAEEFTEILLEKVLQAHQPCHPLFSLVVVNIFIFFPFLFFVFYLLEQLR